MIYGYIRVSTDHQTTLNQEFEITRFCQGKSMEISGWIRETISGTQAYDKRALGKLLRRVGKGDLIICTEISRLGRKLYMIMEILSTCMNKGCQVWTVKEGYRLGDDIQSKVLAFAFGLSAEIERRLISARTREALARRKAEGKLWADRKVQKAKSACWMNGRRRFWRGLRRESPRRRLPGVWACPGGLFINGRREECSNKRPFI